MEQQKERPEATAEAHAPGRTYARGTKKVERIAEQSRGLLEDVKDWIDLKITLTELEIREKIKAKQDDLVALALGGFFGVMALVFLLVTAALGLGAWLGHPAWGFLIVTGLLAGLAGLFYGLHRSRKKKAPSGGASGTKALSAPADQKKLPPGTSEAAHLADPVRDSAH